MFISLFQEMDVDRLIRLRPQLVFLIRLLQRSLPSIDSQLTFQIHSNAYKLYRT